MILLIPKDTRVIIYIYIYTRVCVRAHMFVYELVVYERGLQYRCTNNSMSLYDYMSVNIGVIFKITMCVCVNVIIMITLL